MPKAKPIKKLEPSESPTDSSAETPISQPLPTPVLESKSPDPLPVPTPNRIEPGDERYERLFRYWHSAGRPTVFLHQVQQFLALRDNDQLVFVMDGPPRGQEALYQTISIKH